MGRSVLGLEAICTEVFGVCVCFTSVFRAFGEVLEALKAPDGHHEVCVASFPLFQVYNLF